jgi:hypothetical protein
MDFRAECLSLFRRIRIEAPDVACLDKVRYRFPADTFLIYLHDAIYKMCFCAIEQNERPEPLAWFMPALSAANRCNVDHRRRESFTDQPGSYLAYGKRPPHGTKWLRIYWNVRPRGAVQLMDAATGALDRDNVPFQLKVLLDTRQRRRDAAVLYLPIGEWERAQSSLSGVCQQLVAAGHLHPGTPLFTKKLRSGIGFAEDPGKGQSFGTHRCWIVARSLAHSYLKSHAGGDQLWADLVEEFEQEGLSMERPYLNPGSEDRYEL